MAEEKDTFFQSEDASANFDKILEVDGEDNSEDLSPNQDQSGTDPSHQGGKTDDGKNNEYPKGNWQDDPRWQKRERTFERRLEQQRTEFETLLNQKLGELRPSATTEPGQTPDWFKEAFGENPELSNKFLQWFSAQTQVIKDQVISEYASKNKGEQDAAAQGVAFIQEQLDAVSDEFGVNLEKKLPDGKDNLVLNEFLNFIYEVKPTDDDGNLDLKKGWKVFQQIQTGQKSGANAARKRIAGGTGSGNGGTGSEATDKPKVWGEDSFSGLQ